MTFPPKKSCTGMFGRKTRQVSGRQENYSKKPMDCNRLAWFLMLLHIITQNLIVSTNKQFAMNDHGMLPARGAQVARQVELADEVVTCGSSLHQGHDIVFISEDQIFVGIDDGSRAAAGAAHRLPGELAGLHVEAKGKAVAVPVTAVNVVAHHDHTAVVVLQNVAVQEINF